MTWKSVRPLSPRSTRGIHGQTLCKYSSTSILLDWSTEEILHSRLAAVGGLLIDKWLGVARGATLFCAFILVGQVVFGIGGYVRAIWLMNAGRFIFGIGGESLSSAQNAYAVSWFFGKQLNFVFGLQLSFARVVSWSIDQRQRITLVFLGQSGQYEYHPQYLRLVGYGSGSTSYRHYVVDRCVNVPCLVGMCSDSVVLGQSTT